MDLSGEVVEIGRERSAFTQGGLGALARGDERFTCERSVGAVERGDGVGFALGLGEGAPEQFREFGEHLGQSEAGLGQRALCEAVEELLELSCAAFGGLGFDRRERLYRKRREVELSALAGEQHGLGVDGMVGEAQALASVGAWDAEAPVC